MSDCDNDLIAIIDDVDRDRIAEVFKEFDTENSGAINLERLELMLAKLGVAPVKDPLKKSSASKDKSGGTIKDYNQV
jgi:Ca2+-binding EF-hand superfamily protein